MCIRDRFYSQVPINNKTYKKLFGLLLENENLPIIIHCTAGKDRTGAASALILLALGVDIETVIEDYMLTNIYLEGFTKKLLSMYKEQLDDTGYKNMEYMLSTQKEFLQSTIKNIEEVYGNIEKYFEDDIGINANGKIRLKELYLE
jgi:protein tyrosine/serine phosphatase